MTKVGTVHFLSNCEWRKTLKRLPDAIRLQVYDAIYDFAETGEYTLTELLAEVAFEPIKNEIVRYQENYKERCEKNSKSAKKRWKETEEEAASDEMQTHANAGNPKPDPKPDPKPEPDPKINNFGKSTTSSSEVDITSDAAMAAAGEKQRSDGTKEINDYYNERIIEMGAQLRRSQCLTDHRKGFIRARLKEYGEERVRLVIDKAMASHFLNYDAKMAPVNFDWIMNRDHFPEILEGKYDNKTATADPKSNIHFSGEYDPSVYEEDERRREEEKKRRDEELARDPEKYLPPWLRTTPSEQTDNREPATPPQL